ncbi:hypothetical protein [Catellatospora tritici]|uniref:hypothetical protein n=1 Tax=Catellatospora tritici TaxID=2851566 RepID=UPI001C2D56C0|nr:hypothetical protein [Catellatospora tritici]MBV1855722.1 hypothetical protein [Catellatospora tritici]
MIQTGRVTLALAVGFVLAATMMSGCDESEQPGLAGVSSVSPTKVSPPDQALVAYLSADGLWTATANGTKVKVATFHPEYEGVDVGGPGWLGGGKYLAWSTGRQIHVHTIADGHQQIWNCSCSGMTIFNDKIAAISLDGSALYLFTPGAQRPELLRLHGDRVPADGTSILAASRTHAVVTGWDPREKNDLSSGPRIYVVDTDGLSRYVDRLESAFEVFDARLTHVINDHAYLATRLTTDGGLRADGILDADLTHGTVRRIESPESLGDIYVVGLGRMSDDTPVASIVPAIHRDDDAQEPPQAATVYTIKGTAMSPSTTHWLSEWTMNAGTVFQLEGDKVEFDLVHHPAGRLTGRLYLHTDTGEVLVADEVVAFVPREEN